MRIILSQDRGEAIRTVASMVLERVESHPASVIGLATGRTMEPVYGAMVELALARNLSFEKCSFFMLDEYLGLPEHHGGSFKTYIYNHLVNPLCLGPEQMTFPPVGHGHLKRACEEYEESIVAKGGIDLQLLGIGRNGHVGFNEPGSHHKSRTRIVALTEETIKANQAQFPNESMPDHAMTMGLGTIMEARQLLMLATGESKAEAIKFLLNHHDDPSCPATYLKSHPHFTLVLDPEAASNISLKI